MTEPNTSNIGLIIPATGDLVGTWGSDAINPDMTAIDGLFGGVVTVSLTNVNVTLTSPAGASISPTAGPVQSQNAIIKLSGALTGNVKITLPLPGVQRFYNGTTGNFVVTLAAASAGNIVGIPQGVMTEVFNDGTNVYFCNLGGYPGKMEFLGGVSAVPGWVSACTVKPYLLADTTVYTASDYPALFALYAGQFGGNGITTFGVPDMSGRVPLQYDFTGTRITSAGCGIDGQSIGTGGGVQSVTLDITQIPSHNHGGVTGSTAPTIKGNSPTSSINDGGRTVGMQDALAFGSGSSGISLGNVEAHTHTVASQGGGLLHTNVQPALVAGIWLIKT